MVIEHENGTQKYQSSSPDEIALVNAASQAGIKLEKVTKDTYTINYFGQI